MPKDGGKGTRLVCLQNIEHTKGGSNVIASLFNASALEMMKYSARVVEGCEFRYLRRHGKLQKEQQQQEGSGADKARRNMEIESAHVSGSADLRLRAENAEKLVETLKDELKRERAEIERLQAALREKSKAE